VRSGRRGCPMALRDRDCGWWPARLPPVWRLPMARVRPVYTAGQWQGLPLSRPVSGLTLEMSTCPAQVAQAPGCLGTLRPALEPAQLTFLLGFTQYCSPRLPQPL
jgi:hypothetical protein